MDLLHYFHLVLLVLPSSHSQLGLTLPLDLDGLCLGLGLGLGVVRLVVEGETAGDLFEFAFTADDIVGDEALDNGLFLERGGHDDVLLGEVVCLLDVRQDDVVERTQGQRVHAQLDDNLVLVADGAGVEGEGDAHAQADGAAEGAGVAGAQHGVVRQRRQRPLHDDLEAGVDDAEEEVEEDVADGCAAVGPVGPGWRLVPVDVVHADPSQHARQRGHGDGPDRGHADDAAHLTRLDFRAVHDPSEQQR